MKKFFVCTLVGTIAITIGYSQATDLNTSQIIQSDFTNFSRESAGRPLNGFLPSFTIKEETVGNRYFSDSWVNGSVINIKNFVLDKPSFMYNYDKLNGILFLTSDQKTVVEIDKDQLKSFTLQKNGKDYIFERVPVINNKDFFQPIVKSENRYSLYKLLQTKFVRANYVSDVISESGNKYDEYVDEFTYYIVLPGGKQFSSVDLKKKSIKNVLAADQIKVESYFSAHKNKEVDEDFLGGLIAYLNNQ
jgi:hypothetical protein